MDEMSGAGERLRRIEAAGMVRGQHYTEWIPTLDALRTEHRDDEALDLLYDIITATERAAELQGIEPAPAYTKRAAVIFRRRRDYANEVTVLERYAAACPPGRGDDGLMRRLDKARKLAAQAEHEPPVVSALTPADDPPPPAAWYPDPGGVHEYRYWDGTTWSAHVADAGHQSISPVDVSS